MNHIKSTKFNEQSPQQFQNSPNYDLLHSTQSDLHINSSDMARSINPISFNMSDKNNNLNNGENDINSLIKKLNPTSPTANDNKFNFDKVNLVNLNSNE